MSCTDRWWSMHDERRLWSTPWTKTDGLLGPVLLLVWRWVVALYFFCFMIGSWSQDSESDARFHFAYLTNDAGWVCIFTFIFLAITGTIAFAARRMWPTYQAWPLATQHGQFLTQYVEGQGPRWAVGPAARFFWLHTVRCTRSLHAIALPVETLVLILYWSLLYTPGKITATFDIYSNAMVHAVYFAALALDFLVSSTTLPDWGVLTCLGSAIVYLFANLGITRTQRPVYSILAWDSGSSAVLSIGSLAAVVLFYFAWSGVGTLRDALARRWCRRGSKHLASAAPGAAAGAWFPTTEAFVDARAALPCYTCGCCASCKPSTAELLRAERQQPADGAAAAAAGGQVELAPVTGAGKGDAEV